MFQQSKRAKAIMESGVEIASDQAAGSKRLHTPEARRKSGRSRIYNGSRRILPTTDGRSLWARIMRDTYSALINVHLGGMDVASETQRLMARRISTLEAELVFLEDKFAAIRAAEGEPDASTLDLYGRLADRQRRLADPLGWHRTARPIGPSLSTIIESGTWTGAEDESEPAAGGQP
jgi:hypothetical protein